ncbi:MAG TPA: condensation domain-containing protein, partial [Blastocatellia bacterium]|nr:condensation domain-containing protein [Blastocatellia bacterium]
MSEGKRLLVFNDRLLKAKEYWIEQLSRGLSRTKLAADMSRVPELPAKESVAQFGLGGEAYDRLMSLTHGDTFLMYAAVMAALTACLCKYCGNRLVVIGTPSLRRGGRSRTAPNILPIVNEVDDEAPFRQLLIEVRQNLVNAYEHQDYPFGRLIDDLHLEPINEASPLFDVLLVCPAIHDALTGVGNDITIRLDANDRELGCQVSFDESLFTKQRIDRLGVHLLRILSAGLENPNLALKSIAFLTDGERAALISEQTTRTVDHESDGRLHERFEGQVGESPDGVALEYENRGITPADANGRANLLAWYRDRKQSRRLGASERESSRVVEGLPATMPREQSMRRANRNGVAPVSYAQQRLWFLHRLSPSSDLYNVAIALRIE